jgi:hypothetical protein
MKTRLEKTAFVIRFDNTLAALPGVLVCLALVNGAIIIKTHAANTYSAFGDPRQEYQAAHTVANGISNGRMSGADLQGAKSMAEQNIRYLESKLNDNFAAKEFKAQYRAETMKAINEWKKVKAMASSGANFGPPRGSSATDMARELEDFARREQERLDREIAQAQAHYSGERNRIRGKFNALHNDLESNLQALEASERGGKSRYSGPS